MAVWVCTLHEMGREISTVMTDEEIKARPFACITREYNITEAQEEFDRKHPELCRQVREREAYLKSDQHRLDMELRRKVEKGFDIWACWQNRQVSFYDDRPSDDLLIDIYERHQAKNNKIV